ncbi:hypothetical protein [Tautonia sociabilis]|nr:hypothetical protein [Tautonia sociabilis]
MSPRQWFAKLITRFLHGVDSARREIGSTFRVGVMRRREEVTS